jgi:hypothetical protein
VKYLCDACERLIPPALFRVEQGVLVLTCPRCGGETRGETPLAVVGVSAGQGLEGEAGGLEVAARRGEPARSEPVGPKVVLLRPSGEQVRAAAELARSADPFAVPPGYCPKCISVRQEGVEACPHCGLEFVRFQPEEHRPVEPLATAWVEVLERWDEQEAHDRMLALGADLGELAAVGRLYRMRLAQAPDDVFARRGREEVMRLAAASASSALAPTQPSAGRSRLKLVAMGALFVCVVLATLVLLRQMQALFQGP